MKLRERREQCRAFRNATDAELRRQLNELYRELFNLRMRHATRQLDNDRALQNVRRSIARLKTIMRERELARALQAEGDHV
ncbi:MAG: 50S ribosomal protein L29 [Chloroflexota bacterium]|nr:50S ribosomal protein L29 [Dehalococcoidia bacterium]MDW8254833.1 50S ribosomal protein L29 [Chloroflexota bacterium]